MTQVKEGRAIVAALLGDGVDQWGSSSTHDGDDLLSMEDPGPNDDNRLPTVVTTVATLRDIEGNKWWLSAYRDPYTMEAVWWQIGKSECEDDCYTDKDQAFNAWNKLATKWLEEKE